MEIPLKATRWATSMRGSTVLLCICLWSCSTEVSATNPFDPEAAPGLQAAGSVTGRLVVDPPFDGALLFPDARVQLFRADAPAEPIQVVGVAGDGAFVFEDVAPGRYRIAAELLGFAPRQAPPDLDVGIGEAVDVGVLDLDPETTADGAPAGAIAGRVVLEGAGEGGHGEVVVEAVGTPYTTRTTSTGEFLLQLIPGNHDLLLTRSGYAARSHGPVRVERGTVTLPEALALQLVPGSVVGRVSRETLCEGDAPADGAALTLRQGETTVAVGLVGADGAFRLDDLPAGDYDLAVTLAEHRSELRAVVVVAEAQTDLGALRLQLPRGALTGTLTAGATLVADREGCRRSHGLAPGSTALALDDIPAGAWRLTAVANGFRPSATLEVEIDEEGTARFDAELESRVFVLLAPAAAGEQVELRFDADEDLSLARAWVGTARPPEGLDFTPLNEGLRRIELRGEDGERLLRAQLANPEAMLGDALTGFVSPVLTARLVRDTEPPELRALSLVEGAASRSPRVRVDADCQDAAEGALALRIAVDDEAPRLVPLRGTPTVTLGEAEATYTVEVRCVDAAGNASEARQVQVVYDVTPPVREAFEVAGGAPNVAISSLEVSVRLDSRGATAAAVGEDGALDCANARYDRPPSGEFVVSLAPGEGPRRLALCLRDAAGNTLGPSSSNLFVVDTLEPEPGRLVLGDGAPSNERIVALRVEAPEPVLGLALGGDILEPGRRDEVPATVELTPGDGIKVVTAVLFDAAGNRSTPFSGLVVHDETRPATALIEVAGGQPRVSAQSVPVAVSDASPDVITRAVWESDEASCAEDAPACSDPVFRPFSPLFDVLLSEGEGPKRLCWRFCDAAGNASEPDPAGVEVYLGPYLARPRPVITGLQRSAYPALQPPASYDVHVQGEGLASDTVARIGNFVVPCPPTARGPGCAVSAPEVCADSCVFRVPEALTGRAGTYVVRLETPDPVEGLGTSEGAELLDIVAPVPQIIAIEPRGVVAEDPGDRLTVVACDLTENARFRVGDVFGLVCEDCIDEAVELADCAAGRRVEIELPLDEIPADDHVIHTLTVTNPAPGGGESARPVGLNVTRPACFIGGQCLSDLRWTRLDSPRAGVAQSWPLPLDRRMGVVSRAGGTALSVLAEDGRTLARFTGGVATLPLGPVDHLRVDDALGTGPSVRLGFGVGRPGPSYVGVGRFPMTGSRLVGRLRLADMDADGVLDAVYGAIGSGVELRRGDGSGSFGPVIRIDDARSGSVAVADLNADGITDLLVADRVRQQLTSRLGRADGAFGVRSVWPAGPAAVALEVADFNGDRIPDVAVGDVDAEAGGIAIRLGRGDGTFGPAIEAHAGPVTRMLPGDLDRDGVVDLVAFDGLNRQITALHGRGDGTFAEHQVIQLGFPYDFTLADLDEDGALDLLVAEFENDDVYLADRAGGFLEPARLPGPQFSGSIRVLDVDGNGYQDIISRRGAALQARLATGPGTFSAPIRFPLLEEGDAGPMQLVDLQGDGLLDVVVPSSSGRNFLVLIGQAQQPLEEGRVDTAMRNNPLALAVVDVNGDGRADVGTAGPLGSEFITLFSAENGRFELENAIPVLVGGRRVVSGDFNGDGLPDLVMQQQNTQWRFFGHPLGVLHRNEDTHLIDPSPAPEDGSHLLFDTAAGDFDLDGISDLVWSTPSVDLVRFLFSRDRPLLSSVAIEDGGALGVGDLYGHERPSVVVARRGGPLVYILTFANNVLESTEVETPWPACAVAVDDLDDDGRDDLLLGGADGQVAWLRRTGQVEFEPPQVMQMGARACVLKVADINGDGRPDLLAGNADAVGITIRLGEGSGRFGAPFVLPMSLGAADLKVVDLIGDGAPDLLAAHGGAAALSRWSFSPTAGGQVVQTLQAPERDAPIPAGGAEFSTGSTHQRVSRASFVVRISGEGLDELRLRAQAPDGTGFDLPTLPLAPDGDLYGFYELDVEAWQPAGEWVLTVDPGGADAVLKGFDVQLHGDFVVSTPGWARERPRPLTLDPVGRSRVIYEDTLGGRDFLDASCELVAEPGAGAAERWFEFEVASASQLNVDVVGAFDARVALLVGACSEGVVAGCVSSRGGDSVAPHLRANLVPGRYCVAVDGDDNPDGRVHAGPFQMRLWLAPN